MSPEYILLVQSLYKVYSIKLEAIIGDMKLRMSQGSCAGAVNSQRTQDSTLENTHSSGVNSKGRVNGISNSAS